MLPQCRRPEQVRYGIEIRQKVLDAGHAGYTYVQAVYVSPDLYFANERLFCHESSKYSYKSKSHRFLGHKLYLSENCLWVS